MTDSSPILINDNYFVNADDTYDTVFQTINGFALILRIYLPADVNCTPSMTLHGVRATHTWLDIRMKVIGYPQIASDQSWRASGIKLGDAVHAVIRHFQVNPRECSTLSFFVCFIIIIIDKTFSFTHSYFAVLTSRNNGDHR